MTVPTDPNNLDYTGFFFCTLLCMVQNLYNERPCTRVFFFVDYVMLFLSNLWQNIPIDDGKSETELVVQLYYKDLQSELPSKVRCSNPGKNFKITTRL